MIIEGDFMISLFVYLVMHVVCYHYLFVYVGDLMLSLFVYLVI